MVLTHITRLRLQNIKTYTDSTIEFQEGINGIIGDNGHGKTTILEAIGYALFDYLPIDIKDFVRRGEKWGEVQLWFELDDELEYQIRKGVGRSVFEVHLPNNKALKTRRDCEEWILGAIFTNARDQKDIRSLFTNILGVPQGQFTQAFAAPPTARKEAFDRILRLDEYRQVFEALKAVPSGTKDEIEALERDIKRLEGLSDGYLANMKALEETKAKLTDAASASNNATAAFVSARSAFDANEALRKRSEALQAAIDKLAMELERLGGTLSGTKKNLARRRESKSVMEAAAQGHEEYLSHQTSFEVLAKQMEQAGELEAKAGRIEEKAKGLEEGLKELEARLEKAQAAKEHMKEHEEVPKKASELEADLKRLTKDAMVLEEKERALSEKKKEEQELRRSASGEKDLSARFRGKKKEAESRDGLRSDLARLEHEIEGCKAELSQIQGFKESIGAGKCPFLKRDCPAIEGDLSDYFDKRTKEIQASLAPKAREKSKVKKGLEAAEKAFEEAHALELELKTCQEAQARIGLISKEIGRLEADLGKLEGAKEKLAEAQKALEKLRPNLELFNRNSLIASEEESLVKSIASQEVKRKDAAEEAKRIRTQLEGFKGIKSKKEAAQKAMKELEGHHQRYLEAKALYDRFAGVEEEIAALEARSKDAKERKDKMTDELKSLGFDKKALVEAQEALSNAQRDLAVAKSKLEGLEKELKERSATVSRQEEAITKISVLKIDINDKREFQSFVEFIRDTIRDSGPLIGTRIVSSINEAASEMYSEIISDRSQVLEWTRDYDISIGAAGQERYFRQLSGGEQMAGALAVRLAMLKTLARSDIVFLDEPTQNLDDERRRNLAQQIRSVRGFKQMFVITHDDTFSQDYGYIIRVSKSAGVTTVEYGSKELASAPDQGGAYQETI